MSQGPLCPNLSQQVQKKGSKMANRYAIRWFKYKLKPPKNKEILQTFKLRNFFLN